MVFNGFAPDVSEALSGAALALNLSEAESFSLTCLEAQQLGLPVIAFRSGGPEEIIIDGVTGFLRDLGDIEGVSRSIARLLHEPALARAMGEEAAASVRNRFSPDTFLAAIRPLLLGEA